VIMQALVFSLSVSILPGHLTDAQSKYKVHGTRSSEASTVSCLPATDAFQFNSVKFKLFQ